MQLIDNITAVNFGDKANRSVPIKMVKLRAMDNVIKNANNIMKTLETTPVAVEETAPKVAEVENTVEATPMTEVNVPESTPVAEMKAPEINDELPLTSEEVLKSKKDLLGIEAYKDFDSVISIDSIQGTSRRLKTNPVVPGNINRERNVNGQERVVKQRIETPSFDFSSLPGVNKEEKIEETKITSTNDVKLDEWLNKETAPESPQINSDDTVLTEVTKLQTTLNDNTSSLATQKEILEELRARVANYEALCQARKKELEEKNMDVTRELNDVLAEINELTNLENQYKNELELDEEFGKSKAA